MMPRGRIQLIKLLTLAAVFCMLANFFAKWLLTERGDKAVETGNLPHVAFRHKRPPPDHSLSMNPQVLVEHLAENLEVQYEVVNNLLGNDFRSRITLINHGNLNIPPQGWTIYLYHQRMIEQEQMELQGYAMLSNLAIKMTHINGGLFKMEPTGRFPLVKPGNKFPIGFRSQGFHVGRTDILPNWYITVSGTTAKVIKSTQGEELKFVKPFEMPEKWKRDQTDRYDPFTPEVRYGHNEMEDMGKPGKMVIPTPAQMNVNEKAKLKISQDWVVFTSPRTRPIALILAEKVQLNLLTSKPKTRYISLEIGEMGIPPGMAKDNKEFYSLDVDIHTEAIQVQGQSAAAVFYGVQTLMSLMDEEKQVPEVHINDAPRLPYRGLMIDVARNFFDKGTILKVLDVMAVYKLNKFHLHLTDDEAWRIEIPGLEELTQIGSRRCHDLAEQSCLLPALGSGPNPYGLGSGYFSVSEYKEILTFAKEHHIEVIPEVDLPGHARAAVKSMEARYLKYKGQGLEGQGREFLLSDPDDKSHFLSIQMFNDNVVNPCLNSTYKFVEHVMLKLIEMHQDVQPLRTFHFGGDEVPHNALLESPLCKNFISRHKDIKDMQDLKEYFVKHVAKLAAKHSMSLQGWEDGYYGGKKTPYVVDSYSKEQPELITNTWMNRWEWGRAHRSHQLANKGYKVVLSPSTLLYFDHQQEPDPEERGMYWAIRYTDAKRVFGFIPDSFYDNIDEEIMGKPLNKKEACDSSLVDCSPLRHPENIIGIQGQVWSELIRTEEQLFQMLLPRMLALAERAWHKADWESERDLHRRERLKQEDWESFANTLGYRELRRLDSMGLPYHMPPPGIQQEEGQLKLNSAYPGLPIVYSLDKGHSWQDLQTDVQLSNKLWFATRSFNMKHHSRTVPFTIK